MIKASKVQSSESYLYTTLVKSTLGIGPSIIISKLYSNGRLILKDLISKTGITKKKVKIYLTILLQMKCVNYSQDGKFTYYDIDKEGLLILIYSGEIIKIIKDKYDEKVTEIVQNFLSHGNLTLEDYLKDKTEHEKDIIEKNWEKLINDGWIIPLNNFDFQNNFEFYKKVYNKNYQSYSKSSTISEIKRKKEVKLQTETEYANLINYTKIDIYEESNFKKITFNDLNSSRKIKPHINFKFNLARFFKFLRSEYLEKFVYQRLGLISSKIFALVLHKIEKNSQDCFGFNVNFNDCFLRLSSKIESYSTESANSDLPSKNMTQYLNYANNIYDFEKAVCLNLQDIGNLLKNSDINLVNSIKFKENDKKRKINKINTEPKKKIKLEEDLVNIDYNNVPEDEDEDVEIEDLDNPHSLGLLYEHLELMTNSTIPFLKKTSNNSYYIPFSELIPQLKLFSYLYLIKGVLGLEEFKVLNCIIKSKLIDEKSLINKTLLNEKNVRISITKLFKIQAIEVQEIPKTNDRQAARSSFAYKFNKKYNYSLIEKNLFYEMAKILNQVEQIKDENKLLLIKANREDIKNNIEEMLLSSELNQLKWCNEKELNCVTRFNRARSLWEIFAIM